MTQDEIIEMARQAGFYIIPNSPDLFLKLVAFANLVAAKEREALAQTQEPWCMKMNDCKTKCEDCPDEPPQRTWEPMETAPKDGAEILLMYMHIDTQVVHNGFWIGVSDTDDKSDIGWWSYVNSEVSRIKLDDWMTPTHWLPLPKLKEKNT